MDYDNHTVIHYIQPVILFSIDIFNYFLCIYFFRNHNIYEKPLNIHSNIMLPIHQLLATTEYIACLLIIALSYSLVYILCGIRCIILVQNCILDACAVFN